MAVDGQGREFPASTASPRPDTRRRVHIHATVCTAAGTLRAGAGQRGGPIGGAAGPSCRHGRVDTGTTVGGAYHWRRDNGLLLPALRSREQDRAHRDGGRARDPDHDFAPFGPGHTVSFRRQPAHRPHSARGIPVSDAAIVRPTSTGREIHWRTTLTTLPGTMIRRATVCRG